MYLKLVSFNFSTHSTAQLYTCIFRWMLQLQHACICIRCYHLRIFTIDFRKIDSLHFIMAFSIHFTQYPIKSPVCTLYTVNILVLFSEPFYYIVSVFFLLLLLFYFNWQLLFCFFSSKKAVTHQFT